MNDMVRFCMEKVAVFEQGKGNIFTAAQLSEELCGVSKIVNKAIDGLLIRTILCGRSDVRILGSGYYELKM